MEIFGFDLSGVLGTFTTFFVFIGIFVAVIGGAIFVWWGGILNSYPYKVLLLIERAGSYEIKIKKGRFLHKNKGEGKFEIQYGIGDTVSVEAPTENFVYFGNWLAFYRMAIDDHRPCKMRLAQDGTLQFDTKSGKHTHSIKLSEIPTKLIDDVLYREFQCDINEPNNYDAWFLSLDELEVYLTDDPSLTGYPFSGNAELIWDMDWGQNVSIKLNYSLNHGSGKRDLILWIPDSYFEDAVSYDYCSYGAACDTYVIFHFIFSELLIHSGSRYIKRNYR